MKKLIYILHPIKNNVNKIKLFLDIQCIWCILILRRHKMDDFLEHMIGIIIGIIIGLLFVVFDVCFSGILLFILWPIAIPAIFPGLVLGGYISGNLTLWQSIATTFVCAIIFNRVNNSKVKTDD